MNSDDIARTIDLTFVRTMMAILIPFIGFCVVIVVYGLAELFMDFLENLMSENELEEEEVL